MNFKKLTALLLAACLLFGLTACGSSEPAPTEAPAVTDAPETTEAPFAGGNDVTVRSDYAIREASPRDATMSTVIAVDADGNPAMTNSMLQFVYWLEFFNFMNYYGGYADYFGLNAYTPLAEQSSMAENRTWEQYFLESATEGYAQQYALYRAALDAGYTLTDEEQAQLDDILDPNGSIVTGAAQSGYDSAEAYMQNTFGTGVDLQDYYDYVKVYITANSYYTYLLETYDEAEASAYYDAHAEDYLAQNIQKVNNVSVRHILIQPEGEQDADGNYSDEAWAAALDKANEILAKWEENPTEENFAALANEYSADGGSNTTGGLYEDFDTATMVAEFTEWSFEPARAYGDTGIIKTSYGYHIMFFVEQTGTQAWKTAIAKEQFDFDAIYNAYAITFDFSRMRVFDIITMMAEEDGADTDVQDTPIETVMLPEDTFEP